MTSEEEDEEMSEPYHGLFQSGQQQQQQQQQQQPECIQLEQPSANGAAMLASRRKPTTKSQWSYLAHRLTVYGRTTSMPGVTRLTEASSTASRFYWCLLGLMASSFCIYHVVWLIYAFETSPVSSVLRQGATPFIFPDVTVCSMTPTDATLVATHLNANSKLHYFYSNLIIPPRWMQLPKIREVLNSSETRPDVRQKIMRYLQLQIPSVPKFMMNVSTSERNSTAEYKTESLRQHFKMLRGTFNMYAAGYTLDSLIIRCKFEGRNCKKSEMRLVVDNHLWNCYTMRPTERNVTSMEGLDLFILTHQQHYTESESQSSADTNCSFAHKEYDWATLKISSNWSTSNFWKQENFKGLITNALLPRYDSNGIRVAIHEENTFPHEGQSSFTIDSGKQANMEIRMLELRKLDNPKSSCVKNRKNIKYRQASMNDLENFNDTPFLSTPEDDIVHEYQRLLLGKCGCYSHEVPVRSDLPASRLCFNVSTTLQVMLDVLNRKFNWTIRYDRLETYGDLEKFNSIEQLLNSTFPVLLRSHQFLDAAIATSEGMLCYETHSRQMWRLARQMTEYPPNCYYREYVTSYSVTDWPRLKDIPYLVEDEILTNREDNCMVKKNLFVHYENRTSWVTTAKRVRENVIRVSVRPVSLSSDVYFEEQSYSVWQVVGELGGVLGLWSGLTFTGICELLELLAEVSSSLLLIFMQKLRQGLTGGVSDGLW
ncbi:hypothetical protein BOX15_Mlig020801g1 [Macrostomum lignano]|uniref:Uncharacterized protein n=1 Tax=Macrostomum lignano TaxID=282301 RepID=A0A267F762_9PLAT|nr:hypothetical protein BOX15_Mlig020801g1 [Macrostomum lignano]